MSEIHFLEGSAKTRVDRALRTEIFLVSMEASSIGLPLRNLANDSVAFYQLAIPTF